MRLARAKHRNRNVTVDITAMIDVVFLLIIFFMATAQFSRLTRADVELPLERGEQDQTPDEAGIVINITRAGELVISSRTVEFSELESIVREEIRRLADRPAGQVKLLIRADRHANAAHLNDVVSRLSALGVGSARLATEVPR